MERLAEKLSDGSYITPYCTRFDDADHNEWYKGHSIDRLAAYEDTELEPDTCAEYKKFEDELVASGRSFQHVLDLLKAEEQGRLVVLPCKVGDTVWEIKAVFSYFSKPMEDRVDRIIFSNNQVLVCCTSGAKFSADSVGKTVFLTRTEAERALGKEATQAREEPKK